MNATYTLSNNEKVQIFLWSDLLEKNPYREFVDVTPIYGNKQGKTCKKMLYIDEHGLHFIWNKQRVYIHDFEFEPVESIVNSLHNALACNDRWGVSDDAIWATLMKDTENFGVVIDLPAYDCIMPQLGIGFTGDKEYKVLCIPTEKQYTRDRWHYKITLECECPELRRFIPSRSFYFSDFCSLVREGHAQIVSLYSYKQEILEKKAMQEKEDARFINRIARFFGVEKTHEELPLVKA